MPSADQLDKAQQARISANSMHHSADGVQTPSHVEASLQAIDNDKGRCRNKLTISGRRIPVKIQGATEAGIAKNSYVPRGSHYGNSTRGKAHMFKLFLRGPYGEKINLLQTEIGAWKNPRTPFWKNS